MKTCAGFFRGLFVVMCTSVFLQAQDVYISIPLANIINRAEYSTVENVLYASHQKWRESGKELINPTFTSISSSVFRHRTENGLTLPADVLQFRLKRIRGKDAPFHHKDTWPGFKVFSSSPQTWYEPVHKVHYKGNVDFTFRIPATQFTSNVFLAGDYAMEITHNYTGSYEESFTPERFFVVLSIPGDILWQTATPSKYIEITSLNDFRTSSTKMLGDLGKAEIGHTVDFNLLAKAASASIGYTSSKGVSGRRDLSAIRLGGTHPSLKTQSLAATWKNYSAAPLKVSPGNRQNFILQLSVAAADLRNQFFEAGTYTFQLNLDAKSIDNSVSASQNTDVIIEVPPLSEIVIPASGQSVNFDFNTMTHYRDGQSKVMPRQIRLSNNENFELYVKSATSYFKKAGIQSDVAAQTLQIGVDGHPLNVPLSVTPQKIILNGTPVLDQELDIKYTIPSTSARDLVSKEKTTYSIDVIYSFTAL
ncbi:hypothetical protein [Membranihabitans marinus]